MRLLLLLLLGSCSASAFASHDGLSGYAGRVCYSNGSSSTIINNSLTVCNDGVQQALLNPPAGAHATSVNWCVLRGSPVAWAWCGDLSRGGLALDPDDAEGGVDEAIGVRGRLELLRETYRIDEYEQAEQAIYRGE